MGWCILLPWRSNVEGDMALAARAMIPKKPASQPERQRRDPKDPKRALQVRVGGELREWVEDAEEAGLTTSMVLVRALELARDLSAALGDDWWELERRAKVEGLSEGALLGRMLRAALESEKPQGRKKQG